MKTILVSVLFLIGCENAELKRDVKRLLEDRQCERIAQCLGAEHYEYYRPTCVIAKDNVTARFFYYNLDGAEAMCSYIRELKWNG